MPLARLLLATVSLLFLFLSKAADRTRILTLASSAAAATSSAAFQMQTICFLASNWPDTPTISTNLLCKIALARRPERLEFPSCVWAAQTWQFQRRQRQSLAVDEFV